MKIAVLIKQVPVSGQVNVDPVTHALVRQSSEGMVNPADLNAIEAALTLKEAAGGSVVVFTMAPPDGEQSLREVMARGCDEGCLITDRCLGGADTVATARVLAKAIKTYGEFDLILCGALSADGATGQVGAMVAEFLSIPHVSEIHRLIYNTKADKSMDESGSVDACDSLDAEKKCLDKIVTLRCRLPALFTINFGSNEPRLATLRSKRSAKDKPMTVYTNAELKLAADMVGLSGSPTQVINSFEPETEKKAVMMSGSGKELSAKLRELIEKGGE